MSLIQAINRTFARATLAANGRVADGFGGFQAVAQRSGGDSCAAGLLIVTSANPRACDIHPSPRGRDVLAQVILDVLRNAEEDERNNGSAH